MTLLEHLEELRQRLIWVGGAVGLAAVAGWVLYEDVVERLVAPARPYLDGEGLIFTSPLEAFTTRLQVAVYVGFGIAFPVVLFHVWRFISPGLHRSERRLAVPFIASGFVFFALGVRFALYTLPQALRFLIGPEITGPAVSPLLAVKPYLTFGLRYLIAFGIAFEFPVLLMFLVMLGVISSAQMAKYRRHVFMGIAGASAVLTPPDVYSMVVASAALYVLYEACIWLARLLRR